MQLTTVEFHGDTLIGVRNGEGVVVIPLKPITDALKLDWSGQLQRVKDHPVLGKGVGVTPIPLGFGRAQDMVCLPLNRVNFWLATISTLRIKDNDIRARVILYQEECADVLYAHFQQGGAKPQQRGTEPALAAADIVRVAAEIRQNSGGWAAAEYLIGHAELVGIDARVIEIMQVGRQYRLPL